MGTARTTRILFWCASLAHFVGAMEVLGYNLLLRRALGSGMAAPVVKAGVLFVVVTSSIGALIGRYLTRPSMLKDRSPLFLPLVRGGISSASWLSSIPVLAFIALKTQGYVHPVGFPHFVASVVIACLISTIFSSVCNLWLSLEIAPEAARAPAARRQLERVLGALPIAAAAIPFTATIVYLFLFKPWMLLPGAGKPLEMLIVAMISIGCYGTLLMRHALCRLRTAAGL